MRRVSFLLISFLMLVMLAACGDTGTSSGSGSSPTQAPASPAATAKPTQAPKWTTVQKFTGNGTKKTAIFTVPGDWKILYSCKGQDIGGTSVDGVLVVTVYDSQNVPVDVAVNATCKGTSKATTGETEEHQSGSVYLDVNGTGDWSVQVQVLK